MLKKRLKIPISLSQKYFFMSFVYLNLVAINFSYSVNTFVRVEIGLIIYKNFINDLYCFYASLIGRILFLPNFWVLVLEVYLLQGHRNAKNNNCDLISITFILLNLKIMNVFLFCF